MKFQNICDIRQKMEGRFVWGIFFAIIVLVFCFFAPSLRNQFLDYDDKIYISYNIFIQELNLETVRWAFNEFYTNYWAPITWLSYALDYAIWQLDPFGYHLTNNILHALNSGMLFLLFLALLNMYASVAVRESTETIFQDARVVLGCAMLATILYAVHPLRVQSVSWAAERKDVLSLFFGIPAIIFYLRYIRDIGKSSAVNSPFAFAGSLFYWSAIILYFMSLCSKSTLVTLPAVLLILDWFPLRRISLADAKAVLFEKLPFFICSIFAASQTYLSHRNYSPMMSLSESDVLSRILIAFRAMVAYLWMTVWPMDISPFYVHPGIVSASNLIYSLSALIILLLTAVSVFLAKRYPFVLVVLLVYMVTLFPLLGFVQAGFEEMAARFTYVPGIVLSLFLAVGLALAVVRLQSGLPVTAIAVGAVLMVLFNGFLTVRDQSFWKDDLSLWDRVIDVQPIRSGMAFDKRAKAHISIGNYDAALSDLNEAYSIAVKRNFKALSSLHGERARVLSHLGRINEAVDEYTNGIQVTRPTDVGNLKLLYRERGENYRALGRHDLAVLDLAEALRFEKQQ